MVKGKHSTEYILININNYLVHAIGLHVNASGQIMYLQIVLWNTI